MLKRMLSPSPCFGPPLKLLASSRAPSVSHPRAALLWAFLPSGSTLRSQPRPTHTQKFSNLGKARVYRDRRDAWA